MGSLFSFFTSLAIVPIYLYYFLSSKRDHLADLAGQLSFLKGDVRGDVLYLIRQFKEILEVFFRGQLIIGLMMGVGYAVGFSLSGLKFGIALGLFFGLLNIVPFWGRFWVFLRFWCILPSNRRDIGKWNWNVLWGVALPLQWCRFWKAIG